MRDSMCAFGKAIRVVRQSEWQHDDDKKQRHHTGAWTISREIEVGCKPDGHFTQFVVPQRFP